jgi:hypothetical protein
MSPDDPADMEDVTQIFCLVSSSDDVNNHTLAQAGGTSFDNRPDGLGAAALLADDFSHIGRGPRAVQAQWCGHGRPA